MFANRHLRPLPEHTQRTLETCLDEAFHVALGWGRTLEACLERRTPETDADKGDPVWMTALHLLHLFEVIGGVLDQADDSIDVEERPNETLTSLLPQESLPSFLSEHVIQAYPSIVPRKHACNREDLTIALDDLREEFEVFFGRIVPALRNGVETADASRVDDGLILQEASRIVMHICYHLEHDLLELQKDDEPS